MQNSILISPNSDYHIIEHGESIFLIDVFKPNVIRISKDVSEVLQKYKGKPIEYILSKDPGLEIAIENIGYLTKSGFLLDAPELDIHHDDKITKVALEVSRACNFSCLYCYHELNSSETKGLMTPEIALESIEFLCNQSNSESFEIDFFGGEPLLNIETIKSVVDYCKTKSQSFRFSITANASLVDDQIASYLFANNFLVVVSLDGSSKVHNKTRPLKNKKPSYEFVLLGIQTLIKYYGCNLYANVVLSRESESLTEIIQTLKSIGLQNISLTTVSSPSNSDLEFQDESLFKIFEEEKALVDDILGFKMNDSFSFTTLKPFLKVLNKGERRKSRCGIGNNYFAVNFVGQLLPCHRFLSNNEFSMGNIYNGFDKLTREKYLNNNPDSNSKCKNCWARYICGGPCLSDSFEYNGSFNFPAEIKCKRILNLIELSVILYGELYRLDKNRLQTYLIS